LMPNLILHSWNYDGEYLNAFRRLHHYGPLVPLLRIRMTDIEGVEDVCNCQLTVMKIHFGGERVR
jgi:hypothetical protein